MKRRNFIPISAAGLNRDSRLEELGTADFYQDCELNIGEDKALLTSDCAMGNMVMWADGEAGDHSYSTLLGNPLYRREPIRYKAALGQKPWVPCSWHFLKMWEEQMDQARKINSAVGVSNGWIEFNGLHGLDANTRNRLINEIKELY